MEIQTFGAGNNIIAAGCKGTVGDGSCYFDEFVRHISPQWTGHTSPEVGTNLDLDVEETTPKLQNVGYNYATHQGLLLPSVFKESSEGTLNELFEKIGDRINACRSDAIKKGDTTKIAQELERAKECLAGARKARLADEAKAVIAGVKKKVIEMKQAFVRTLNSKPATQTFALPDVADLFPPL